MQMNPNKGKVGEFGTANFQRFIKFYIMDFMGRTLSLFTLFTQIVVKMPVFPHLDFFHIII